jgi:hypothetical protein
MKVRRHLMRARKRRGFGIAEILEPGLFVFWPTDKRTCWHCAYHEVALGPGIDEG